MKGFKPVGWVAAVAGAALGCYMLSLNVAAERAELAKIERKIVAAKQDIRALQTELGTRGRLEQLEQWNAEVLALSAPNAAQFLDSPVTLARFETREPTFEERATVRMAAAPAPVAKPAPVQFAAALKPATPIKPLVHRAAFVAPMQPVKVAQIAKGDTLSLVRHPREMGGGLRPPDGAEGPRPWGPAEPAAENKKKRDSRVRGNDGNGSGQPAQALAALAPKPAKPKKVAPPSSTGMLDDSLLDELGAAARSEQSAAGAGAR